MSNGTLFYICGGTLAVSAVVVTLAGLRLKDFPGRFAPLVALWFIALIGASTTLAVLHARDEQQAKASALSEASEEVENAESGAPSAQGGAESEGGGGEAPQPKPEAKGQEETLQLAASPTKIAFDTTSLSAKAGTVTIDFDNPSPLEHNVAIEQNGKQIAISETLAEGEASVSADLEPGTYTYLCTIPGHAEAGMEGVLTVR